MVSRNKVFDFKPRKPEVIFCSWTWITFYHLFRWKLNSSLIIVWVFQNYVCILDVLLIVSVFLWALSTSFYFYRAPQNSIRKRVSCISYNAILGELLWLNRRFCLDLRFRLKSLLVSKHLLNDRLQFKLYHLFDSEIQLLLVCQLLLKNSTFFNHKIQIDSSDLRYLDLEKIFFKLHIILRLLHHHFDALQF